MANRFRRKLLTIGVCVFIGALIGAGASLIGGALSSKSQRDTNKANAKANDPATIRRQFEAAGFNPLLGVDGWTPHQAQASGSMGQSIAEAGGILGTYFSDKAKEQSEVTKLQQQNQKLGQLLRDNALRPRVGGIFGGGPGTAVTPTTVDKLTAPSADPIRAFVNAGETIEKKPMEEAALFKNTRVPGWDEPFITFAEPDVDETLANMVMIAPQMARRRAQFWEDRMVRELRGQTPAEEKQQAKKNAARSSYGSTTMLGTIDRARSVFGLRPFVRF